MNNIVENKIKRQKIFKILYNITCGIAWALLFTAWLVGFVFHQLTVFWIIIAVIVVDVGMQIAFWNLS